MSQPKSDALISAAQWLEHYESSGDGDEIATDCAEVAKWLRSKAHEAEFRQACKEAGVSVKDGRRAALIGGLVEAKRKV